MQPISCLALCVLVMTGSVGCTPIYRHTVSPFTTDFGKTPVVRVSPARSDLKQLRYGYYLDVRWDSNAIGDIAKTNGIGTIYYADSEVVNILGIWKRQVLRIYGEPLATEQSENALNPDPEDPDAVTATR